MSFFEVFKISINYSSYTLEDLDHPILNKVYCYYWDVTLFLTTAFAALMFYTILKKSSKEMGGYKWYLIHQLFWSYIFDLYMGLWKPIPLWPFYLGYSGGIFSRLSSEFSILPLVALNFVIVGMGFGIFLAVLHRYVQATPFSRFYNLYSRLWLRFFTYITVFIEIQAGLCIPLYYNAVDTKLLQASITSQNPEVGSLFFREPSMFGYDPALNQNQTVLFMAFLILVLLILLVAIILLYFNYIRILYKNKNQLSPSTYKLQKLLFKALYLQMILAVVLLIIPITLSLTLAMFGFKWISKFSLFAFMLISTHAIVDFAILTYFIKPYRMFIIGLLKISLAKIGFKFKSSAISPNLLSAQATSSIVVLRR